jgi:CHAT domain-containing protein/tetratricopeptide (TPR) repeat protein
MRAFLKVIIVSAVVILLAFTGATGGSPVPKEQTLIDIQAKLDLADSLRRADQPDSAIVLAKATLEWIQRELGESSPLFVRCLKVLGDSYHATDRYAERAYYNQWLLNVLEQDSAVDRATVASVAFRLGEVYRFLDRYSEAELCLRKALRIMEDTSAFPPYECKSSLKELAVVCTLQLRYAEAESLLRKAIRVSQEAHKEDDYKFAGITNVLGYLYFDRGLYAQAESLYKVGAAIRERRGGPKIHSLSESLNNLGEVYEVWGRYAEAESLYLRALRIREEVLGYGHPHTYYHLANLGELCALQGRYAEADYYLNRALDVVSEAYGSEHSQVARCLKALGDLYRWQEEYERAEVSYRRALETNRKVFGSDHPSVTDCLYGLALLYGSMGDYGGSLAYYKELLETKLSLIENVFSYASEDQKMRFAHQYAVVDGSFLSLARMDGSQESKVQALRMTLKGKGIVFDALSAERQIAYCLHDDNVASIEQQHKLICGKISAMSLENMRKGKIQQEYLDTLQALRSAKDSLEVMLSSICSSFREELLARSLSVGDAAAALPEASVLWEFVRYEPYDFSKTGPDQEKTGRSRYAAITLDGSQEVTLTDLGDAARIDSLVGLARKLIYEYRTLSAYPAVESEKRLNQVTGKLYQLIFAPLEAGLGGKTDIFVSLDGQLNLLPLEILVCPDGGYVVEKYSISYLSSGRDLLKFGSQHEPTGPAVVMVDPDFDFSYQASARPDAGRPFISSALNYAFEPARGVSGCLDVPFTPLSQTREEGKEIAKMLETRKGFEVSLLFGRDACEEFLKSMTTPPRVLHLGTHSDFCKDLDLNQEKMLENPLVRCGLAFAGANLLVKGNGKADARGEDGFLTGFEASGLNLFGTELVVLSACETGLGEVKNGEGVYGLKRAFQLAGARTIVMSLWKVRDEETRQLMTRFYQAWLSGSRKKDALRQAEISILSRRRAEGQSTHPLFWGGFVLLGDPY